MPFGFISHQHKNKRRQVGKRAMPARTPIPSGFHVPPGVAPDFTLPPFQVSECLSALSRPVYDVPHSEMQPAVARSSLPGRTTQAIGQQHTSPLRAGCEARRRDPGGAHLALTSRTKMTPPYGFFFFPFGPSASPTWASAGRPRRPVEPMFVILYLSGTLTPFFMMDMARE